MSLLVPPSPSRRQHLRTLSCGFGYLALAGLANESGAANALTPKPPRFPARAKRVIFIFMQGGPSHVDTFDFKPRLEKDDGLMREFDDARTLAKEKKVIAHRVMRSPWSFQRYGRSGRHVSDLFPHVARHVDDLCFLHGMHTEGIAHGPATLFLHTGSTNMIRPSLGSWVNYGLGSENANLPGFISICPSMGNGGPRNYHNAFLPAAYQGTAIGRAGIPAKQAGIRDLTNRTLDATEQKRQFELLRQLNGVQMGRSPGDDELEAVIASYELAFRMQTSAPDVFNLATESPATLGRYGIGEPATDGFGRQCLMARRMAENGVRFIQVNYGDNSANPAWDQHSNLKRHADHARACDKPIAGLLEDLKERGLLEDTLVWWGGEFGRTPYAQNNGTGRDHNPDGFTVWLAGGGVKAGSSYGETDEFGHQAIDGKVHMHDLHATILHLLGLDHEQLTYRYDGRNFRLTDVHGQVVREIIA